MRGLDEWGRAPCPAASGRRPVFTGREIDSALLYRTEGWRRARRLFVNKTSYFLRPFCSPIDAPECRLYVAPSRFGTLANTLTAHRSTTRGRPWALTCAALVVPLVHEDRVVAYHAALTKFARSTSTDESRKQLEETLDSLSGSGAIDARREEIVSVRNEQRVEEIESRFDYGVQLLEQPSAGDMRKFGRRRSSSLLERAGVVTAKFPA
uniref:Uncharacterized protein n=1 Tax=Plectus sambesii TaxID=2011161 RepID=A0A914XG96_9BILA